MTRTSLARRRLLIGAGASVLAPTAMLAVRAAVADPLRQDNGPSAAGEKEFSRLRCGVDGDWALWRYSGVLVLKPEGRLAQPVCRIEGLSFNRMSDDASGQRRYQLDEVGYFCDLATGEILETLHNPFTDSAVEPGHYRSQQQTVVSGMRVEPAQTLPPGIDFRGEITMLADIAPLIAMTEDLYVRVRAPAPSADAPQAQDRIYTSLATFTARRDALFNPQADWVDTDLSYTTMNSFVEWLDMDDIAGVQNMRLVGRKSHVGDLERVGGRLLPRIRRDHADFLDVPFS